jgi:hypothetical protein
MLACSGIAMVGISQDVTVQAAVLAGVALIYASLAVALEKYFARHAQA